MIINILLVLLGLIILGGIIRVVFRPTTGFLNMLIELLWLDFLFDALGWVFEKLDNFLED